jgi:hypothetical protein
MPTDVSDSSLSRGDLFCWLAVMAAFAVLQFSLAGYATHGPLLSRTPRSYYQLMSDAVISGQLSLKIPPRPELLTLSDPYDPRLNAPFRLIDLSLYRGRYYFYWGLAPVIMLFAPCFLLTGAFPSEAAASALFGLGCQGCMSWLLLVCRRHYFPGVGWCMAILALLCTGIASFLPSLAMADWVWSVPVACAAFCQAFAWCCIYRALHSRKPFAWSLLAGVGVALAIGSRANYILWSACFILPLWHLAKRRPEERIGLVVAAAAPPFLAVVALLAINWSRFGRLTDFGLQYMLDPTGRPSLAITGSNLAANVAIYGWNPPLFSKYFPFFCMPPVNVCGMLGTLPAVYLAAGLLLTVRMRSLSAIAWAIFLAGFGGMLAMAALPWVAMHYMVDFIPASLLVGAWGGFVLADLAIRRGWWPVRLGVGLALAASLVVALVLQAESLESWLPWRENCERLRPISRVANAPLFCLERIIGAKHGPLLIRFKPPRNRIGAFEPLVTVGSQSEGGEIVFITYVDDRHVKLGLFQTRTTQWMSQPLELDFSRAHELRVSLGSLLPPDSDPVLAQWSEADKESAQQDVNLVLDGQLVYKTALDFGIRHGEGFRVGENQLAADVCQPRFTGEILDYRVLPLAPMGPDAVSGTIASARQFGGWRITVMFPSDFPKDRHDPILVSGVPGAADFIYAFYPRPGTVAFGHDSWGLGGSVSQAVSIDPGRAHAIVIRYGGLYPAETPPAAPGQPVTARPGSMKNRLLVQLDGITVMDLAEHTYDAPPDTVTPAENRIGGSTTTSAFSGHVISAGRLSD